MPTALVTGAAGFVGSHLVEELLGRGYRVMGIDNLTTGSIDNLSAAVRDDQFTFIEGDIRDEGTVTDATADVDFVFHYAAYTSVPGSFSRPPHVSAVNCTGTATVLNAAVASEVESVVLASSAAVYGSETPVPIKESTATQPESPYASSKLYAEQLGAQIAAETAIDVVSLRLFNVYGPRQDPAGEYSAVIPTFIGRMVNDNRPIIYGDGEQTRDFVFVKDVITASLAAATSSVSGIFNVGSGERVSIRELVSLLNELLETSYDPVFKPPRSGDIRHSCADISKARDQLQFTPKTRLSDGLSAVVSGYSDSESAREGSY